MEEGIIARTLEALKESGLTWGQITEELGMPRNLVSHLRGETKWPSIASVKRLARHFGWSNEELGLAVLQEPQHLPKKRKRRTKRAPPETP